VLAVPEESPLAGPETWPPSLRVATKYPNTTASWFEARGQSVEVVRLHGSVELAPLVGLVDGIVDLTATGRTLRENRLRIASVLGISTARLIANQASLKTRTDAVQAVVARLRDAVDQSPAQKTGAAGASRHAG
jgi:ATP phosphoribosyltransferase